jgi:hypothetical protein
MALIKRDKILKIKMIGCAKGYNKFDLFLDNEKYRPFDGCKIEI